VNAFVSSLLGRFGRRLKYLAVGYVLGALAFVPLGLHWHIPITPGRPWLGMGGVVGMIVAWIVANKRPRATQRAVHGSARFATLADIKATLCGPSGLIVGRYGKKREYLLRHDGPAHLLTIAPTRSGKGVGAIIPNLLTADRSIFCIDPKGENARITAPARARFGPVHVLDPFGVSGHPSAHFNPLDGLDPNSPDLAEDAALLADALVYDPPDQAGDAHWNEEAKALIGGLILYVVCNEALPSRTLATVRELLTSSPREFATLLEDMQKSTGAGGLVRRAANRHLGKSEREAAGVLSSAQRHTHFLDSVRINTVMASSDFRFADLKAAKTTVFLVLPPERLDAYARWLRLMVAQSIHDLARAPGRPAAPVLFLLDEFAALGRLEPVERAFGLMAGYGLQLWPILQDMHQLRAAYGERSGTFLSNAGLVQVFNVADLDTATWVSRSLGAMTMAYQTTGTSTSRNFGQPFDSTSTSTTAHLSRRDLMTPDEVMRMASHLELLLRPGHPPAMVAKLRYYDDPAFQGLF
jgi:type IV secretion system protein VirD4